MWPFNFIQIYIGAHSRLWWGWFDLSSQTNCQHYTYLINTWIKSISISLSCKWSNVIRGGHYLLLFSEHSVQLKYSVLQTPFKCIYCDQRSLLRHWHCDYIVLTVLCSCQNLGVNLPNGGKLLDCQLLSVGWCIRNRGGWSMLAGLFIQCNSDINRYYWAGYIHQCVNMRMTYLLLINQ